MLSPIQTRRHWIRRIAFEPEEVAVDKSNYSANITLKHLKLEKCWQVCLSISFGGKKPGEATYIGRVEFEGIFDVHPDFPPEKTDAMVRMNGGAILYGAARELIMNLTARSKHGPFELPTIDARMFIEPPPQAEIAETGSAIRKSD
ncbi:MAG: protein-export chaperone SecB [Akkermansiaceae bacterium]|nr:protein-export chaperone SecB [Akkermansiaceae bacterium]